MCMDAHCSCRHTVFSMAAIRHKLTILNQNFVKLQKRKILKSSASVFVHVGFRSCAQENSIESFVPITQITLVSATLWFQLVLIALQLEEFQ